MFKKTNRLTKSEFEEYFKRGKKNHFPHLTIVTSLSKKTKVSVVVSKKVAKSAVRRNILKRRVYASLRELSIDNRIGVMIVILKPSYNSLSRKESNHVLIEKVAQVIKGA